MSNFFEQDIIGATIEGRKAVLGYTSVGSFAGDNDDGSDDIVKSHGIALAETENYLEDGELYTRTINRINVNAEELDSLIEILQAARLALAAKNKEPSLITA